MKTVKRRLIAKTIAIAVFIAVIGLFAAIHWFDGAINAPGPLEAPKLVYIAPGTATRVLAQQLKESGVIDNLAAFRIDARIQSRLTPLKAGEYTVPAHISLLDLVTLLQSGKTFQRKVTIPEGLTSLEIVALLDNEKALKGKIETIPPEGSLLPQTYDFSYGDTRLSIVRRMQRAMTKEMTALWAVRAADYPLTRQQAVVLASIIEKETSMANERARVAGVFFNRLKRGIPLQSDPTVIFALTQGKAPLNRTLTAADMKIVSPYNTYTVSGLPPTAICNPGTAALKAALDPEKNDYLYFVADGRGGSSFSKTLQQHKREIRRWLRVKKERKK